MKKTYFYSEKQADVLFEQAMLENKQPRLNVAPNGKVYTERMSQEGEHKSLYSDAVVVCETTGHKVDEFMLEQFGLKFAK